MVTKKHHFTIIIICLSLLLLSLLGYAYYSHNIFKRGMLDASAQRVILPLEQTQSEKPVISKLNEEESSDATPVIAIFLNDFGLNKANSDLAMLLPHEVAFGVSVYNPSEYQGASTNVHDSRNLLLNIPMAPIDYNDNNLLKPLLPQDSAQDNLSRLNNMLSFFKNYQGVYSDEGEIFTKQTSEAELFLSALKQKNLLYLCGLTDKNATIYKVAKKIDFHILANDVILDEILAPEEIVKKLKQLEEIAYTQGYALAKASQYKITIETLKEWLPSLADKNIRLVSIEDYYKITKQRRAK